MFKISACFFAAMVLLMTLSTGLAAQNGYYVEQNFAGPSFSPRSLQITPDGFCYTYGTYFYYDGEGPFVYGTGFSGSDPYGNMLWSNINNYNSDGTASTVGIDVEANGDFHTLTTYPTGSSYTFFRLQTTHISGLTTSDLDTTLDAYELSFVKALRLPDTDIAAVGSRLILVQNQWVQTASYYRFSSAGELISTTSLYLQPGNSYPAHFATDMLLKDNGNLLIALKTFPQAAVVEITPEGQVISSTPIPGYLKDYAPLRLIPEPGTENYLAGLMSRFSETETYQIRLFRIGSVTAELLYEIDTELVSELFSIEGSDSRIFIVGNTAPPVRLAFLCLDQLGTLDWTWYRRVSANSSYSPQNSALGPDGSLHWVGITGFKQILVKILADGSFVSVNDNLVPEAVSIWAYPNPTRESAKLSLSLPQAGLVCLKTYNQRGQLVKTEDFHYSPGVTPDFEWEAKDNTGNRLSPGVYFLKLEAGASTRTARIIVMP